jgi:ABC-type glycerol-3-phosphate transport system permease component
VSAQEGNRGAGTGGRPGARAGRGAGAAALWALAGATLVPLYFVVSTALRPGADYAQSPGGLPEALTLSNFDRLFESGDFLRWLGNSVLLTGVSTAIVIAAGVMAAHALTYMELPGAGIMLKAIASLMVIPPILLVVPLFVELATLDLLDSYAGAILIYAGLALPFAVYMLARFFDGIPRSVIDAARVDGAGPLRVLAAVVVPLTRPAIAALALITAFFVWNDLLIALVFLQSEEHRPLMAGLTTLADRDTQAVPVVVSGVLLSIVPIVVLYLALQRFLVRGFYTGGTREA